MDANRKKLILIIIVSVTGSLLVAALGLFLFFKGQFGEYKDTKNKFSMRAPAGWKIVKNPQPGAVVVFISPKENALDLIQENISVVIQPVPAGIASMPTYSDTIKKQLTAVFSTNIKIIEDKTVKVGYRTGHRLAYDALKPDHVKFIHLWTIKGDKAYIVTFFGDMNVYKNYALTVDEVFNSFQVK